VTGLNASGAGEVDEIPPTPVNLDVGSVEDAPLGDGRK